MAIIGVVVIVLGDITLNLNKNWVTSLFGGHTDVTTVQAYSSNETRSSTSNVIDAKNFTSGYENTDHKGLVGGVIHFSNSQKVSKRTKGEIRPTVYTGPSKDYMVAWYEDEYGYRRDAYVSLAVNGAPCAGEENGWLMIKYSTEDGHGPIRYGYIEKKTESFNKLSFENRQVVLKRDCDLRDGAVTLWNLKAGWGITYLAEIDGEAYVEVAGSGYKARGLIPMDAVK